MSLQELFERYDDAWGRHDLDAIVSLHTDDSVFQFHIGDEEVKGREGIRAAFGDVLERYQDLRFEPRNVRYADDFIVNEYVIHTGGVSMDAVDVFSIADGLVARKDTYVDATVLAAAQAAAA
jgi:uncharacterized protein (TIGR02246 family)